MNLSGQFNANSVIIAVCGVVMIAVMRWVGTTTDANAQAITEMKASMPFITQGISRVEQQFNNLVTRQEFENRMDSHELSVKSVERRIIVLETEKKVRESIPTPK